MLKDNYSPQNILVRMPNWLGDAVMATAFLGDLRKIFPKAKITALALKSVGELLQSNSLIDEIIEFEKINGWIQNIYPQKLWQELKNAQYDMGFLLTNSFSSAWHFWQANVKNIVGFSGNCRYLLLDHPVAPPNKESSIHQVDQYRLLLKSFSKQVPKSLPKLYLSASEIEAMQLRLKNLKVDEGNKLIGLNPGAAYGSAKCWPYENFKALATKLIDNHPVTILCLGDKSTSDLAEKICQISSPKIINLTGKTDIRELLAVINCLDLLVTNDSGPMHIAAALNRPLVALFGSTSDVKTGPYNYQNSTINKQVACSPCYLRTCPIDFKCMRQITVDEVYNKVVNQIKN